MQKDEQIKKMKGELKRLRHDLIMKTKNSAYVDEDEDITAEELDAFTLLSSDVR